jgi:hypothetical protein
MGRRAIVIVCSTIFLGGFASAVDAASLNVSQGEVLLSRGAGYETVTGSANLRVGDTVLGKPGSEARVIFADGCTVPLGVGTVFRIRTKSPCNDPGGWKPTVEEYTGDWTNNPVLPYLLSAAVIGGIAAVVESGGGHQASP